MNTVLVSLLFFLVIGALAIAFFPDRLEQTRAGLAAAPGRTVIAGVSGLAIVRSDREDIPHW